MFTALKALMPDTNPSAPFVKVINSLKLARYTQTQISYLDQLNIWLNLQSFDGMHEYRFYVHEGADNSKPFSAFHDEKGYCGIKLTRSLLQDGLKSSTHLRGTEYLPPPDLSLQEIRQIQQKATKISVTAAGESNALHVPKILNNIPTVAAKAGTNGKCEWWPRCKSDRKVCGGYTRISAMSMEIWER